MASNTSVAVAMASCHTLTSSELENARRYLEQTRKRVIGALNGLSEVQWMFKPAAGNRSIAEIVEHMIVVQELVVGLVRAQQFPNRLNKVQAPEFTQPTGLAVAEASGRLMKNRALLSEYFESIPDLRPLKALSKGEYNARDGYQWILAAAAHNERHTKQILEVRAEANFPGK